MATSRQYRFMIGGLAVVAGECLAHNVAFRIITGDPGEVLPRALAQSGCGLLVTDFDPLRIKRRWRERVLADTICPVHEVDAHNIVPCRFRVRQARIRPPSPSVRKSTGCSPACSLTSPRLRCIPFRRPHTARTADFRTLIDTLDVATDGFAARIPTPGPDAAPRALEAFIATGLDRYADTNGDPVADTTSRLSPYLHFGHIAPQRAARAILDTVGPDHPGGTAFLEQLIVRRELADNFCRYCPEYDSLDRIPNWARMTLDEHRNDPRDYIYDDDAFEAGQTHDPLWNAAQKELLHTGFMHNYLRMYWAKKILEWSPAPEDALATAIRLNDTYQLDGRDPNGYAGIIWSIGGVHDRAWGERPVFGKIRYMSYTGCRRKFDVDAYIAQVGERLT